MRQNYQRSLKSYRQGALANGVEITRTQKAPDPASCSKGNLKRLTRCEDAPKSSESEIDIQKPQQWDQSRPATDEAQVCQQWQMRGKMAKNLSCLQSGQVAHWLCDRQHKNLSRLSGKGYGESGYQSDTGMVGRIQRLRVVTSLKIRETK